MMLRRTLRAVVARVLASVRILLAAILALAACTTDEGINQPLSATMIRQDIVGRTFTGLIGDRRFFITFAPNGSATYIGADTQFIHWNANDQGLCIRWYDTAAEKCAPMVWLGYSNYKVGSIDMREFAAPPRF